MKPQKFFHDHSVIDERDDGIYLYFTPCPHPTQESHQVHPRRESNNIIKQQ